MIYLIIFISLALLCFAEINSWGFNEKQLSIIYWIFTIFLILLAGTRFHIGFDYLVYKEIFETVDFDNYLLKTVEIGFASLNYFVRTLGFNFNTLLFIVAFTSIILKASFFKQYSGYIFLGLLNYYTIGLLMNDMGQMRFGLAIGFSLLAFKDVFQNHYKASILKILFAFLFHSSAIVILPVILIIQANLMDRRFMIPILLFSLTFIFIDLRGVIYNFLKYIPMHQLRAKMLFYIYSDEFGAGLGFNISLLLRVLIFSVLYYFTLGAQSENNYHYKLLQLYFYGLLLYIVFNSISEFATRSSAYFKTLDSLILPYFVSLGKTKFEKNILAFLIVAYTFWSFYKIIYSSEFGGAYNPYNSFLFSWIYE